MLDENTYLKYVAVGHHVIIEASRHRVLKKFVPMIKGCVLRTAGSFIYI